MIHGGRELAARRREAETTYNACVVTLQSMRQRGVGRGKAGCRSDCGGRISKEETRASVLAAMETTMLDES
jgi:hypothetical protein